MILRYSPTGLGPYGGDYPDERPRTRGECMSMPRPCPFVSCRYHLAIDAHRDRHGETRLRVLNEDPTTMANTCALDVAEGLCHLPSGALNDPHEEAAETTLDEIAGLLGNTITVERVRQTIEKVQAKIRKESAQDLEDYAIVPPEDAERPRPLPALKRAQALVLTQLKSGPAHLNDLVETCGRYGIGIATTKHAVRLLGNGGGRNKLPPKIMGSLKTGQPRGTWTLVGTGKADLRHPGHSGKAGRSD